MSGALARFLAAFGAPAAGTGVELATLGLEPFGFLRELVASVGGGLFLDGMLSVASRREQAAQAGAWAELVPAGARHFATSGLGDLFFASPDGAIWFVATQYGKSMALPVAADELFEWLADEEHQLQYLSKRMWELRCASLGPTEVLAYAPALAMGGPATWENLQVVQIGEHLAIVAQMLRG